MIAHHRQGLQSSLTQELPPYKRFKETYQLMRSKFEKRQGNGMKLAIYFG